MWLARLGDILVPDGYIHINYTYRIFGEKHFLFSNNGLAVDTIRELMESKGFKERWIDVSWDENHEEYVTYLFFIKDKYELGVWFNYYEVDKTIQQSNYKEIK